MASISLTDSGGAFERELIEPGLYLAICYQMIQIGTIKTTWEGVEKDTPKVRIGWELPDVRKVFKEENGEQPRVISREYTATLHENGKLRADLKSWRGVDFSPEDLKKFELTRLLKAPCMLNIGHRLGKDGKTYEEITAITRVPKNYPIPELETPVKLLTYDDFDWTTYESLPDFLKEKIKSSREYQQMQHPQETVVTGANTVPNAEEDPLPF